MVDHHLHIQSAEASALLRQKAIHFPERFRNSVPSFFEPRSGNDALRALDDAGIRGGVLLSEGYMFASPFARSELADYALKMRIENQFNVEAALGSEGRLKAFIGLNPIDPSAEEEIEYWRGRPGVSGVKLHLGNSEVNPESPSQVQLLADCFAAARKASLPIVVHARTAQGDGPLAAKTIVAKVLSRAGGLTVQLAHAGGWGGLDATTIAILEIYGEAIAAGRQGTENLIFDLAVVGVRDTTNWHEAERLLIRLTSLMRQIGLSRFVLGSDWPSVFTPREHLVLLQSQYQLELAEWLLLMRNRAAYMNAAAPQT
jgi:predicted TIM-barrel fold metal-dependent hydrolase